MAAVSGQAKLGAAGYAGFVAATTVVCGTVAGLLLSTGSPGERIELALSLFVNVPMLALLGVFWLFLFLLLRPLAPSSVGWIGLGWRGGLASMAAVTTMALALAILANVTAGNGDAAAENNPLAVSALFLFYFGYIGGPVWIGVITALPLRLALCGANRWPWTSGKSGRAAREENPQ